MPILKKKMSASAYVLIALLIVVAIAAVVLHIVGIWDLSFIGEGFGGIMVWAATDPMNGALLLGGVFVGGMITFYALKTYLFGTQIPLTAGTYMPMGQQISPQSQKDEVVVSE